MKLFYTQVRRLVLLKVFLLLGIISYSQKTWVGSGSGGAGTDFNTAANWSPVGVPTATDNVLITMTATGIINLSANSSINNLTFTITGKDNQGYLFVGAFTLTVNGTTDIDLIGNINPPGATIDKKTKIYVGVNSGASAGVINFIGNVDIGKTNIGGSNNDAPSCFFIGNVNSSLYFRANLTMGVQSGVIIGASRPGTIYFDGTGTQNITWNNILYYADFYNVVIGGTNNPTVNQITGTINPDGILNNLTINGSSTFNLGTSRWNHDAGGGVPSVGGTLNLNSTATLKLGNNTLGQAGSNFPLNFATYNLSATSTVEYTGTVNQTVYDVVSPGYGHLTTTNNSTKSPTAGLDIRGNVLINTTSTFGGGTALTHTVGGNWTNNGAFTSGTSTINFNGTLLQTIGGSTSTNFYNISINNTTNGLTQTIGIGVAGAWTNNGIYTHNSSLVTFNGTAAQSITGTNNTTFNNLTISNTWGKFQTGVTLLKPTTVVGTCTFNTGVFTSTSTNLLILNDNANASGANNNANPSFVNGPVKKIGDDAIIFPVGKVTVSYSAYRYCAISAPANVTDAFTAEFIRAPARLLGLISDPLIYNVSYCEYWTIDRTTGTSNVDVTLSWSTLSNCPISTYVNNLTFIAIAHFNGTTLKWDTHGGSVDGGSTVSVGSATWPNVSIFSPFSLTSTSPLYNPLPIKLTSINAYKVQGGNKVEWSNLTEQGVNIYELEKSADGRTFDVVNAQQAKKNNGSKADYNWIDVNPFSSITYYRIRAIERTGNVLYSPVVKVQTGGNSKDGFIVYPNPVIAKQFTVQLSSPAGIYKIKLINNFGQEIMNTQWQHLGGSASKTIELNSSVSAGVYHLQITSGNQIMQSKILIQ